MMAAESMLDDISRSVRRDPLDVRYENLYREGRDTTPYGQKIEQHILLPMMKKLETDCRYRARKIEISQFNESNKFFLGKVLLLLP